MNLSKKGNTTLMKRFIKYLKSVGYNFYIEDFPFDNIHIQDYYHRGDGLRLDIQQLEKALEGHFVIQDDEFYRLVNQFQGWRRGETITKLLKGKIPGKKKLRNRSNEMKRKRIETLILKKF